MSQPSTPLGLTAPRRCVVLGVLCLALMMVVAAVASLNIALPDLARDTGATQSQLQWIVDDSESPPTAPALAGGD
jgi:hypothetical protein